jgi:type IV fimbrial biogenesis protein FimT
VTAGSYMKYFSLKNAQGLTLLELLITMAIIIILSTIAVPSYSTFMANERFAVASNDLNNAYRFARNEALKTSSSMTLDAVTVDDDGNWTKWQVKNSSGDILFESKTTHSSIIISGTAITVLGMGSLSDGGATFSIIGTSKCSNLSILSSGQSQLESVVCS